MDGDVVNVDVSVYYQGYHGDLNETFVVGRARRAGAVFPAGLCSRTSSARRRSWVGVFSGDGAGAALIRPGTMYRDIGSNIRTGRQKKGLPGGQDLLRPRHWGVVSYGAERAALQKNKAVGVMKAGHIFTIEPMINLGGWRDRTWPDDWTAVTAADGSKSAQFERQRLVTEDG